MKIKLLRLLLYPVAVVIICIILLFIWLIIPYDRVWEKPENVPDSAVWVGGCDGGNWIELVDFKEDTIRFRLYADWNGELILDADFVYQKKDDTRLTKANWDKYLNYFDGEVICTQIIRDDNRYCLLIPVFPAYYQGRIIVK